MISSVYPKGNNVLNFADTGHPVPPPLLPINLSPLADGRSLSRTGGAAPQVFADIESQHVFFTRPQWMDAPSPRVLSDPQLLRAWRHFRFHVQQLPAYAHADREMYI